MRSFIAGSLLAVAAVLTAPSPATAATFAADPLTSVVVPNWGTSDIPPATATWRRVVVRDHCRTTVTRVWVRQDKGRWHLESKHIRRHKPRLWCVRVGDAPR